MWQKYFWKEQLGSVHDFWIKYNSLIHVVLRWRANKWSKVVQVARSTRTDTLSTCLTYLLPSSPLENYILTVPTSKCYCFQALPIIEMKSFLKEHTWFYPPANPRDIGTTIIHVRLKNIEDTFCEKARHMKIRKVFYKCLCCTTHPLGMGRGYKRDINRISVNVPKDLFDLAKEV